MILALRTDKPEAELYIYDKQKQLAKIEWPAHRELTSTLNKQMDKILNKLSISYSDVDGIVVFAGPGSFTGLRIGLAAANALAYSLGLPIVARRGHEWLAKGLTDLKKGQNDHIAEPFYGEPAKVTKPRK